MLGKKARIKTAAGIKIPMTQSHIDAAFELVKPNAKGEVRGIASLFLEGIPLGPWTYAGTSAADPNDVIAHEDRREVRASRVLAAWLNHFDIRDQNTINMWIAGKAKGSGHVRHHMIDFGDCFGSLWQWEGVSRRLGHAYYLDFKFMAADFLTLGLIKRVWEEVSYGPAGRVLAYYNVKNFTAGEWHPGYPNLAYDRMTEADGAWMARIIAEFSDRHVEEMVKKAKIQNKVVHTELIRILNGRRDKILTRWFQTLSPLSHPRVEIQGQKANLCVRDLALYSGVVDREKRIYSALAWKGINFSSVQKIQVNLSKKGDQVCSPLPAIEGASSKKPEYLVIDFIAATTKVPERAPLRVHLYQTGALKYRIVGLERPEV